MNTSLRFTLTLTGACAVLPAAGVFAQAPTAAPSATPSVSVTAAPASPAPNRAQAGGQRGEKMREALAALTPQEREELKAAHEKAMADPAVKAAEAQRTSDPKAFRRTMFEAMVKIDPNVKGILMKMHEAAQGGADQ